jgi:hypothetical protein
MNYEYHLEMKVPGDADPEYIARGLEETAEQIRSMSSVPAARSMQMPNGRDGRHGVVAETRPGSNSALPCAVDDTDVEIAERVIREQDAAARLTQEGIGPESMVPDEVVGAFADPAEQIKRDALKVVINAARAHIDETEGRSHTDATIERMDVIRAAIKKVQP